MKSKKNKLIAVIDVGAHSMRLNIGQLVRKGVFTPVEQLWVPITIGKDTFSKGIVSNRTIKDVLSVLRNFKEVITSFQVDHIYAVATSSLREASNADVMIDRIYKTTGINIQVIESIVEARILYHAVSKLMKDRFGFMEDNVVLFSLGAGSTQIVFQSKGDILFSETFHQGTLRLLQSENRPDRYYSFIIRPLTVNFVQSVKRLENIRSIDRFVVVNDDARKIIENTSDFKESHGVYRVSRNAFLALAEKIAKMDLDKFASRYQLHENVAGTTKLAFLMINTFFTLSDAREILFPVMTLSSALLSQLSSSEEGVILEDPEMDASNIISAARTIGMKYQYDQTHADHVLMLSMQLFDQMADLYGFSKQERVYLQSAAILHDLGSFISAGSHHKHSSRLISTSEILGLTETDLKIIAQIARYHRKATPRPTHTEYMSLEMSQRVMVSRLASLLRIADALDAIHTQQVEKIKVDIDDNRCVLYVHFRDVDDVAFDIFRISLKNKGDLFESFFGIPVQLERI